MTYYTLKPTMLDVTLGEGGAAIENCTLSVVTRVAEGETVIPLVAGIKSAINGTFSGAFWDEALVVDPLADVVALYSYESPVPYVEPVFETIYPLNVKITGTRIDIIGSSGGQDANTVNTVMDVSAGAIYVYQFETNMNYPDEAPLVRMQSTSDVSLSPPDSEYLELAAGRSRFGSNLTDGGANFGSNISGSLSGTVILNTTLKTLTLYASAGNQVATFVYNQQGELAASLLYLGLNIILGADIGDYFEFFCDKTIMPYDLEAGDLGVYLAANPNWKQVGEVLGGAGTQHPPRAIVASPVEVI
jgi:hypothetical protein